MFWNNVGIFLNTSTRAQLGTIGVWWCAEERRMRRCLLCRSIGILLFQHSDTILVCRLSASIYRHNSQDYAVHWRQRVNKSFTTNKTDLEQVSIDRFINLARNLFQTVESATEKTAFPTFTWDHRTTLHHVLVSGRTSAASPTENIFRKLYNSFLCVLKTHSTMCVHSCSLHRTTADNKLIR